MLAEDVQNLVYIATLLTACVHPHIGTDKLPRVIENMRNTIIQCGGEVHFETRMDALLIEKDEDVYKRQALSGSEV